MNVYKQRILNVVRALRESSTERFTMAAYSFCGTPACALGHYASRQDLQEKFYLGISEGRRGGIVNGRLCIQNGVNCSCPMILEHFGINVSEAVSLFNSFGCGGASSATAAADYLERFARTKWPEPQRTDSELVADLMTRVTSGERIPEDA